MDKCQECGLIHPEAPSGKCPIAKTREMEGSDKGRKIISFISKLSVYLENSDDWESIISKINNQLGNRSLATIDRNVNTN